MFLHTLMLLVATGYLADRGIVEGRQQNYNSNTNYNEVYTGYGIGKGRGGLYGGSPRYDVVLGPEMANGKNRGGSYGGLPKYDIILGPEIINGKDRGESYGGLKKYEIILDPDMINGRDRGGVLKFVKGGSTGSPVFGNDFIASEDDVDRTEYDRGSCDALADILIRDDDDDAPTVIEEPADDDGGLKGLFDDNSNYNVFFKGSNRRYLSQQPYGLSAAPSRNTGSKPLRSAFNWGTLRPPYLNSMENDRTNRDYDIIDQDYDRINQDYGRINQEYDRNSLLYDRILQDLERPDQDYVRGYHDMNVNTNSNYNVFGGRRGNSNSNANNNNNARRYDRYDQDGGEKRYEKTPSYSSYGRGGPSYGPQGIYGGYTTGYPSVGFTPRPAYGGYRDKDTIEDDDEYTDPEQNVNSNVNMNSNVNVMSRRQNVKSMPNSKLFPRKKRSANKFPNASERIDLQENQGAAIPPEPEISTAAKSITGMLKPRNSINRDLM